MVKKSVRKTSSSKVPNPVPNPVPNTVPSAVPTPHSTPVMLPHTSSPSLLSKIKDSIVLGAGVNIGNRLVNSILGGGSGASNVECRDKIDNREINCDLEEYKNFEQCKLKI